MKRALSQEVVDEKQLDQGTKRYRFRVSNPPVASTEEPTPFSTNRCFGNAVHDAKMNRDLNLLAVRPDTLIVNTFADTLPNAEADAKGQPKPKSELAIGPDKPDDRPDVQYAQAFNLIEGVLRRQILLPNQDSDNDAAPVALSEPAMHVLKAAEAGSLMALAITFRFWGRYVGTAGHVLLEPLMENNGALQQSFYDAVETLSKRIFRALERVCPFSKLNIDPPESNHLRLVFEPLSAVQDRKKQVTLYRTSAYQNVLRSALLAYEWLMAVGDFLQKFLRKINGTSASLRLDVLVSLGVFSLPQLKKFESLVQDPPVLAIQKDSKEKPSPQQIAQAHQLWMEKELVPPCYPWIPANLYDRQARSTLSFDKYIRVPPFDDDKKEDRAWAFGFSKLGFFMEDVQLLQHVGSIQSQLETIFENAGMKSRAGRRQIVPSYLLPFPPLPYDNNTYVTEDPQVPLVKTVLSSWPMLQPAFYKQLPTDILLGPMAEDAVEMTKRSPVYWRLNNTPEDVNRKTLQAEKMKAQIHQSALAATTDILARSKNNYKLLWPRRIAEIAIAEIERKNQENVGGLAALETDDETDIDDEIEEKFVRLWTELQQRQIEDVVRANPMLLKRVEIPKNLTQFALSDRFVHFAAHYHQVYQEAQAYRLTLLPLTRPITNSSFSKQGPPTSITSVPVFNEDIARKVASFLGAGEYLSASELVRLL